MTTQPASLVSPSTSVKSKPRTIEQQQRIWGWIFLSPWVIGFLVFTLFPMVASLVFSFTNFSIGNDIKFVGLDNWINLYKDPVTRSSLWVTLRFALISVPIAILFPLGMAALMNSKLLVGKPIFRALFYMPYIVPAISGIFVWQSFLNGQTGYLNRILRLIGIVDPPNWLFDARFLNIALVMIGLWGVGNAMLTMMAGMQGVPTELYEAARVDGANGWTLFRRITLPMISPVILYNLVLTVIGLMQYFTVPYILSNTTRSNPDTNFFNLNLYRTAFQYQQMGFASAQAWFIFIIALILTIGIFATSRRWVYYASGE